MDDTASESQPSGAGPPLGVLDAAGLGWRLLMSDFWRLWLAALVMTAVASAVGCFGLPAAILVQPPLAAGFFYVIRRRIDGGQAKVGDLFAGFKERFGESVVGYLPVSLGSIVFGMVIGLATVLLLIACFGAAAAAEGDDEAVALVVLAGVVTFLMIEFFLILALSIFCLFFFFVPAAVWDNPGSGWASAKASARLVRDHFLSMLGLLGLFWLISAAANLVGMLACCVGWIITVPAVMVWFYATLVYLYRSWTGQRAAMTNGE